MGRVFGCVTRESNGRRAGKESWFWPWLGVRLHSASAAV